MCSIPSPRVRTQLGPPDDGGHDDHRGEKVPGQLVVSSGEAAEVLETPEHAFDEVALAIGHRVIRDRLFAAAEGRNDRFGAQPCQSLAKAIGIVGLVGNQAADSAGEKEDIWSYRDIVQITRRQQQYPGSTKFVGQRMDCRRAAAARSTDRFPEGPPFPPAAERCALM